MTTGGCDEVICVHGLWMPGMIMAVVRRRLESDYGFRGHEFSYHSVAAGLDENIEMLRGQIESLSLERAHIVAHSLGGVLTLHTLRRYADLPIERIVCLGSPLVDSRPARQILNFDWGQSIVGRTLAEGVIENPLGEWTGPQRVGVVAGTTPFGVGNIVMSLDGPNDGVVSIDETRLPGIADHVELPVSHSGMLVSHDVVEQTAAFLRDGRFTAD